MRFAWWHFAIRDSLNQKALAPLRLYDRGAGIATLFHKANEPKVQVPFLLVRRTVAIETVLPQDGTNMFFKGDVLRSSVGRNTERHRKERGVPD